MHPSENTDISNVHSLTAARGFSLIELLITIAIISILATITIPSYLINRQRSDVAEAVRMADTIREDITAYYYSNLSFPADNAEADIPEPGYLIGNNVTGIEIQHGAIHITLGNKAAKSLQGKTLSLRPAVVTGSPKSPISWLCGSEAPVDGMEAAGQDRTDLKKAIVPASCGN